MSKPPKLKVFCTPTGFYNALVAAPSQKAALKAWGTTTDLFGAGRASVVDDPALQAAALARPGEIIKVPRGDVEEMLGPEPIEPEKLGTRSAAKRSASAAQRARPRKPDAPAPPLPDRSQFEAAERALLDAEQDHEAELEGIAADRAELDRRELRVRSEARAHLSELRREKKAAEKAYAAGVEAREAWRAKLRS